MREIYRTAGTVSFLKWNRVTVVSDSGKQTDYRIISQPVEERLSGQTEKEKKIKHAELEFYTEKNISKLLAWSEQDLS